MARVRVSVMGLMAVVGLFALEFAALRAGTQLWFSVVYTVTVVFLLFAVLTARYRRGVWGAFWFGFAVFGWGYFLLAIGPWSNSTYDDDHGEITHGNANLYTSRIIVTSLDLVRGDAPMDYQAISQFSARTTALAHLIVTLAAGLFGGLAAVALRWRRQTPMESSGKTALSPSETRRPDRPLARAGRSGGQRAARRGGLRVGQPRASILSGRRFGRSQTPRTNFRAGVVQPSNPCDAGALALEDLAEEGSRHRLPPDLDPFVSSCRVRPCHEIR